MRGEGKPKFFGDIAEGCCRIEIHPGSVEITPGRVEINSGRIEIHPGRIVFIPGWISLDWVGVFPNRFRLVQS